MSPRLRSTAVILAAFCVSFGVYLVTLHRDVAFWDVGDLQTVPYILGIPYPTGYPGYVLLGWLWTHIPAPGMIAVRLNLFAAVASAATVAAVVTLLLALGVGEAIALGAAAAYAIAGTPWQHSSYIDVHTISWCAGAWALVFAVRWKERGAWPDFVRTVAGMTAALAIDNTMVLIVPGVALVALSRRPPLRATAGVTAVAALALVVVYAYLPLRSAAVTAARIDPTLALAGVEPGRPFWDDGHPATRDGFIRVVTGADFSPHLALLGLLSGPTFTRIESEFVPTARAEWGPLLPWLALLGVGFLWWRRPLTAGGFLLFGLLPLFFTFAYGSEADNTRYYLGIYFVTAAAGGYGAHVVTTAQNALVRWAGGAAAALALVALLVVDVRDGRLLYVQARLPDASPFIARVAQQTPPHAVIVAPWVYATALAYGAYVENTLGDRIVMTANPHDYQSRYRAWLRRRPLVVVSDDALEFRGFAVHEIVGGSPHLYVLR